MQAVEVREEGGGMRADVGGEMLFVPARPWPFDAERQVAIETRTVASGQYVALVFSSPGRLASELGECQPWVANVFIAYGGKQETLGDTRIESVPDSLRPGPNVGDELDHRVLRGVLREPPVDRLDECTCDQCAVGTPVCCAVELPAQPFVFLKVAS